MAGRYVQAHVLKLQDQQVPVTAPCGVCMHAIMPCKHTSARWGCANSSELLCSNLQVRADPDQEVGT